jgi:DNA-directed RNA polymerase alpha subunit
VSDLDGLGLSTYARRRLRRGGYTTAEQVRRASDSDLLDIPYVGPATLAEIRDKTAVQASEVDSCP